MQEMTGEQIKARIAEIDRKLDSWFQSHHWTVNAKRSALVAEKQSLIQKLDELERVSR